MNTSPLHVLLVEDDEIDIEAVRRSFVALRIGNPITVVNNGLEALDILRGAGGYERLPRPYIILLDLNMPLMNGIEFLEALRKDEELKSSVVFVLTTSTREEDMTAAYKEQVAGYFVKKNVGEGFLAIPQLLDSYWQIVEFPPGSTYSPTVASYGSV